ncbi:hypothetical protein BV22DRAFT_1125157 [Leucogyrophana mollusca]|uniref:Uncharacterized protein n=1 Tax=Leucogyrophana mollusca TaxID=85980 RepID=A0ACB8BXI8_9AGAM|nr:hypothetical protein BV22DRAFT_1125157 [Leucogyrophana mollusca]
MARHPTLLASQNVFPTKITIGHVQLRDLIICPREAGVVNYIQGYSIIEHDLYAPDVAPRSIADLSFNANTIASLQVPDTNKTLLAAGGQESEIHLSLHDPTTRQDRRDDPSPRIRCNNAIWQYYGTLSGSINNSVILSSLNLTRSHESSIEPTLAVSNNDYTVKFYDIPVRRDTPPRDIYQRGQLKLDAPVNHSSISPDGRTLLSVGDSDKVHLHQLNGGSRITFTPIATLAVPPPDSFVYTHTPSASFSTAFSNDGMKFAVASQEGVVAVWDVRSSKPMKIMQTDRMRMPIGQPGNGDGSGWLSEYPWDWTRGNSKAPGWGVRSLKFGAGGSHGHSGHEIMTFTEHTNLLHIIDARTFETEEIVRVGGFSTGKASALPRARSISRARFDPPNLTPQLSAPSLRHVTQPPRVVLTLEDTFRVSTAPDSSEASTTRHRGSQWPTGHRSRQDDDMEEVVIIPPMGDRGVENDVRDLLGHHGIRARYTHHADRFALPGRGSSIHGIHGGDSDFAERQESGDTDMDVDELGSDCISSRAPSRSSSPPPSVHLPLQPSPSRTLSPPRNARHNQQSSRPRRGTITSHDIPEHLLDHDLDLAGACFDPSGAFLYAASTEGVVDSPTPTPPVQPSKQPDVAQKASLDSDSLSVKEQRRKDWTIVKRLMGNVWPKNDWGTRGRVVLGFGLLISGKVLNVQVPQLFKSVIDALNIDVAADSTVWVVAGSLILGYGAARVGATLFGELLNAVFANIGQRAIRKVARETFEHLLNLDLKFHLSRQTGGLTRAIDRGTKGITFMLQAIIFRIVPTALEISMVCGILTWKFGWDFAAITAATLAAYTWFTVRTTSWRTQFRRDANKADNKAATVAVDSLINYEAVKHFNNEKFEIAQYDKHLKNYESASVKITTSLAYLNSGQNIIFSSALTATMFLAAQGVMKGTMTIGDLVMVNQLIFQLSLPLNFLGSIYRELRQNLLDMEVLFNLQTENVPLKDKAGAKPLVLKGGAIRFENVNFGYHPDRPIFRDLSFTVPAGKKVAIVGPSGCGKSTVFRLLYRFYEPSSGRILVDDQDIHDVQMQSLRQAVGVVPQDTPLFHSDISHNVRYGRLDASDEEVEEAAKKASVHETVLSLPDGYKTTVGERGLMISGGEKQRLAIARVLLKNPPILFFDEATSALDAHTEAELMRSINTTLLDSARTSIFIAHRLRTVVEADLIIVMKEGQVAEQGTHEELLRLGGLYHNMWVQQASDNSPEST